MTAIASAPFSPSTFMPVAWHEMVSHRGYLVRFAQRKLHDPMLAEDVVHDVFEAVISGRAAFAGRAALRSWLTAWPEKVMFGSDAFDGGVEQGWEQVAWVASNTARRALSIALTGMMRDGEITRDRAQQLARMVLRENAATVYAMSK